MLKAVFVLVTILVAQQGQAQFGQSKGVGKKAEAGGSHPSSNSEDFADVIVQADEKVGAFNKGAGKAPKNNHSAKVKGVKLNRPHLGGSGCPEGTVGVTLTPDNKTLSVIFDNYIVQAGRSFNLKRDIKNCSVRVPVEVPAGYQFAVVKLDYRGYNSIPEKAKVSYLTIYSFTDIQTGKQIGRRIRRQYFFKGPLDEEYTLSSDVSSEPIWSSCGRAVQFGFDTRAIAATNGQGDDVMGTIDSIDASVGTSGVEYHLVWQACQ